MNNLSVGQLVAKKYRIEKLWHQDAASQTFFATQVLIDKPVVLKTLNSDLSGNAAAIEQFQAEARILSRLTNQHVLNVLDYGTDETNVPFLVLENAEGRTLQEIVQTEGGLRLDRAVKIINQICEALAAAHAQNVVHGDLSSDKILIAPHSNAEFVKILDFGAFDSLNLDEEKTVVHAAPPFYKAPEQLENAAAISPRSDIYALGVIFYEMLAGKVPFAGDSATLIAQKHLQEIPPSLLAARPDLPPALEQIAQRALAKQPNQRFQTADDFAAALNQAVSNSEERVSDENFVTYSSAQPTLVPVEASNENRWKTAFIVLAGITLMSLVTIFLTSGKRTDPPTQLSADPNSQPVQPINPLGNAAEDLNNTNLQPSINSNANPVAIPPGVTGVPQGIPPGLYPSGTVTIPGDSNSIFMQDLNANAGVPANGNRNANTATNVNQRPAANANVAPSPQQRPANANTGMANPTNANNAPPATTATPTPAASPKQTPRPAAAPPNGSSNKSSNGAPSNKNNSNQ